MIPDHEQKVLHHKAVKSLEMLFPKQKQENPEVFALHWEKAGDLEQASHYYLVAARLVKSRYALEEAARLYSHYLKLNVRPSPQNISVRIEFAVDVLVRRGKVEETISLLERSLLDARTLNNQVLVRKCLQELGKTVSRIGDYAQANMFFERALETTRENKDHENEGQILLNLADIKDKFDFFEDAVEYFEQAMTIFRAIRNREGEWKALRGLAKIYYTHSHLDEAHKTCEQALFIQSESGENEDTIQILGHIVKILTRKGLPERIQHYITKAQNIAADLHDLQAKMKSFVYIAEMFRILQDLDQAQKIHEQTLEIARNIGDRLVENAILLILGRITNDQDNLQASQKFYENGLEIAQEIKDRMMEGIIRRALSGCYYYAGKVGKARTFLHQALDIFVELNALHNQALTLISIAQTIRQTTTNTESAVAKIKKAISLLQKHPLDLMSAWCELGHISLALGTSAEKILTEIRESMKDQNLASNDQLNKVIGCLEAAEQAFRDQQHDLLFRGELIQEIPVGLRHWLVNIGQLEPERAKFPEDKQMTENNES
ncbi:tetratricopeptide repeat protein [candidate division CSSED10-310 bacterium]|uniref:Tetratricopeptide repeat protein n=1 Tax=candidate division CSSED10-310 bacterium TaxID=2855610 RepID=A0ABV6Z1H6_UNCC1